MRRAIDTNILVRYLTWDDDIQSALAAEAIEKAETIIVSPIVLCETVWVLQRAYQRKSKDISAVLKNFAASATVELDRPLAEAGFASLDRGGDFADGVVLLETERAKADELVTFDRAFFKRAKSARLRHLGGASQPSGF